MCSMVLVWFMFKVTEAIQFKYSIEENSAEVEGIRSEFIEFLKGKERCVCREH